MASVSVIIVSYNSEETIRDSLDSLSDQLFTDFEVIVVDNFSRDGTRTAVESFKKTAKFPLKTIYLGENKGFCFGNNIALKEASGSLIALLNPDAKADRYWLHHLVLTMNKNHGVGICASKLLTWDGERIDSAGDGFSSFLKGFKRGEGEKASLYNRKECVFSACAGAALYRKGMLDEIGFLDEDFFLIHEDTDLSLRARLSGWEVLYVPTALAYHKVNSSIGHMSDTAVYYTIRNTEFVRIKNIPISVFIRCLPTLIFGVITELFYFAVKHRRPVLYFKAKFDALKMLPAMLKKRKAIMKFRKASYGDIMAIMTPVFEKNFFKSKLRKLLYG